VASTSGSGPLSRPDGYVCIIPTPRGYDGHMSESSSENESGSTSEHETPEVGLIPDEDLPEDLQPDKNPLAADPDDESGPDADSAAPKVDGMPDMGQPG
jgi:hypothetical protein